MISRRHRPRHPFFDLIHEGESDAQKLDRELDAADRQHDIRREDEIGKVPMPESGKTADDLV